jgi:serine/threonine protein phosphatase PrpC
VKPPYNPPYIYSEPDIQSKRLDQNDRFVLLATDGLWDHMSNADIIEIMQDVLINATGDQPVVESIPSRLVHLALTRAAEAHNVSYAQPFPEAQASSWRLGDQDA